MQRAKDTEFDDHVISTIKKREIQSSVLRDRNPIFKYSAVHDLSKMGPKSAKNIRRKSDFDELLVKFKDIIQKEKAICVEKKEKMMELVKLCNLTKFTNEQKDRVL